MAYELPLTADGERTFICTLGTQTYKFRTYFVSGQTDSWLMDIFDLDENLIAAGIRIVPGSANILKGYGDAFNGINVIATLNHGKAGDMEALGSHLWVAWFDENEEPPVAAGDPMENIGYTFEIAD